MEIVVSGIRPTGNLHLGNYFGAIKSFLQLQEQYKCFFFIADWHLLTTDQHPDNIQKSIYTTLSEYLACGVNPEKSIIYVQSDVKEISELYLYLNMNAGIGELMRTVTFKDKARKQLNSDGKIISAGLLTYPTLMSADILIHKATKVPVGKDQEQNVEIARTFTRAFNKTYKVNLFPEPIPFFCSDIKIPGLDGLGKMGKSEENAIYLIDDKDTIRKKVLSIKNSEVTKSLSNIININSDDLTESINSFCSPIREKILEFNKDTQYLNNIIKEGSDKARESASKTLSEVRKLIGYLK